MYFKHSAGQSLDGILAEMDMPQPKPIKVWGDNRISVELAKDARSHPASAHFARRISYTQDNVEAGIFAPMHLTTTNNPVDFFGKLVTVAKYRASISYLMNLAHEVPPTNEDWKRAAAAYEAAKIEAAAA